RAEVLAENDAEIADGGGHQGLDGAGAELLAQEAHRDGGHDGQKEERRDTEEIAERRRFAGNERALGEDDPGEEEIERHGDPSHRHAEERAILAPGDDPCEHQATSSRTDLPSSARSLM